jgi:hypothetical protein
MEVVSIMEEASRIVLWDRLTFRADAPKVDLKQDEVTQGQVEFDLPLGSCYPLTGNPD